MKLCKHCSESVKGRSDKKFCDSYCRSAFHNKLKSKSRAPVVREVIKVLMKNRRILNDLSGQEVLKVSIPELKRNGFQLEFFTNYSISENGDLRCFCFDMGYEICSEDFIKILPIAS